MSRRLIGYHPPLNRPSFYLLFHFFGGNGFHPRSVKNSLELFYVQGGWLKDDFAPVVNDEIDPVSRLEVQILSYLLRDGRLTIIGNEQADTVGRPGPRGIFTFPSYFERHGPNYSGDSDRNRTLPRYAEHGTQQYRGARKVYFPTREIHRLFEQIHCSPHINLFSAIVFIHLNTARLINFATAGECICGLKVFRR